MLLLLMFPMGFFWQSVAWHKLVLFNLFAISAGTLSFAFFYALTVKETHGGNWLSYLKLVPVAISVGAGIAVNNSKAVLEAFIGRKSEFVRTPKFAVTSKGDNWRSRKSYISSKEITALIEITLGLLFCLQTLYAIYKGYYGWIPFLLIIQFGFLYTGFLSIMHSKGKKGAQPSFNTLIPKPVLQREKDY